MNRGSKGTKINVRELKRCGGAGQHRQAAGLLPPANPVPMLLPVPLGLGVPSPCGVEGDFAKPHLQGAGPGFCSGMDG